MQTTLSASHPWFWWNAVPFFWDARKINDILYWFNSLYHHLPASYQPLWPHWQNKNMMTGSSLNRYLHGVWSCLWGICNRARSVDLLRAVDHLSEVLLRGSGWGMWISSTLSGEESDIVKSLFSTDNTWKCVWVAWMEISFDYLCGYTQQEALCLHTKAFS